MSASPEFYAQNTEKIDIARDAHSALETFQKKTEIFVNIKKNV